MCWNARFSKSGRRVYSAEQSIGVNSHLWGFTTRESARSHPSSTCRISGRIAAVPPYEASTWSHIPWRPQISAIAGTGSMAVVEVVPTVATTATGTRPARRSFSTAAASAFVSILSAESVGIFFRASSPKPSVINALSTLECASSEQ